MTLGEGGTDVMYMEKNKKAPKWIYTCFIVGIFALCLLLFVSQENRYKRKNFIANSENEPYAQGIPLDEMNFKVYARYLDTPRTLTLCEYVKEIELPCDVHYYGQKEDRDPVLTQEKGTRIYVLPSDQRDFEYCLIGYGIECWPDYQKGWRYGKPFLSGDGVTPEDEVPAYFVRTEELEAVAKVFYQENKKYFREFSAAGFAKWSTRTVDRALFKAGAFCSEDLLTSPLSPY